MMTHPFVGTLTEVSTDDLQGKISDLQSKMIFASRMGRYDMVNQINMVLASYREEYEKRQRELWDKAFKKYDDKVKIDDSSKKL